MGNSLSSEGSTAVLGFAPSSRFYRQEGCFRAPFLQAFAFLDPISLARCEGVHVDLRRALAATSSARNKLWRPHFARAVDPLERDPRTARLRAEAIAHTPAKGLDFRLEYLTFVQSRVAEEALHMSGIEVLARTVEAYRTHAMRPSVKSVTTHVLSSIGSMVSSVGAAPSTAAGATAVALDAPPPTPLDEGDIAVLCDVIAFDSPAVARAVALKRPSLGITVVHRDATRMMAYQAFASAPSSALARLPVQQKCNVALDSPFRAVEAYAAMATVDATRKARCAAELPSVAALAAPGFIDYAVRLARLRPEHEHLRDSALWMVLTDLMVFDTVAAGDAHVAANPRCWYAGLDYVGIRHHAREGDAAHSRAFVAKHPDGYVLHFFCLLRFSCCSLICSLIPSVPHTLKGTTGRDSRRSSMASSNPPTRARGGRAAREARTRRAARASSGAAGTSRRASAPSPP